MKRLLIVAVLLLAGCSDDTGRYARGPANFVLDTQTGCLYEMKLLNYEPRRISLRPMDSARCKP